MSDTNARIAESLRRLHADDAADVLEGFADLLDKLRETPYGALGLKISQHRGRISHLTVETSLSKSLRKGG